MRSTVQFNTVSKEAVGGTALERVFRARYAGKSLQTRAVSELEGSLIGDCDPVDKKLASTGSTLGGNCCVEVKIADSDAVRGELLVTW